MVCSLHNYDFMWKDRHFFAKNEWKEVPYSLSRWNFVELTTREFSHLTPSFYFEYNETNYSFRCSRCDESINSTFETKSNKFTNLKHASFYDAYDMSPILDDYLCAFIANNTEWFSRHNRQYLSLNNPLCLCK